MKTYPAELRAEAQRIAAEEGIGYSRISKRLGVPATTVARWIRPDYAEAGRVEARERKRRMTGICEDCGGVTRYNGHGERVSRRCAACGLRLSGEAQKAKAGTGPLQLRLHALLAAEGELRFMAIAVALGITSGHTNVMLLRELKAGRVVRVRRGVYALPEKP